MNVISKIVDKKLTIPTALWKAATDLAAIPANDGKMVMFTISVIKDKRTFLQNNYYWALMDILSQETGYTQSEAHAYCKSQFIKQIKGVNVETVTVMGEIVHVLVIDGQPGDMSTTRLNTKQFTDYIELIRTFFREKAEIYLPTPDTWEQSLQ